MITRGRGMAGVGLLVLLPLMTACIDEGPTLRSADKDDVLRMTESWTGVALPEDLGLVSASYVSDFLDPSLSAVFDTRAADIDAFVGALGHRRVREYAPDCSASPGNAMFTEVPGSDRLIESALPLVPSSDGTTAIPAFLARLVESGELDRCRNVVVVDARPKGTLVSVTSQVKSGDMTRVRLSVVTM